MSVLATYILTITIGAISIGQMLILNQTLEVLEMGYNEIGDDGITAIAKSLSNSSITNLDVKGCSISYIGVKSLAAAFQNICSLWLSENPISVDRARLIMKSAIDNGECKNIDVDDEYQEDNKVKEMMAILDDRRMQDADVRKYIATCC